MPDPETTQGILLKYFSKNQKDGIFPLKKTGKANYDKDIYKKITVGINQIDPSVKNIGEMVAGMEEWTLIQAICYNCHKFIGKMEETSMNNKIGLCMGECSFDQNLLYQM